MNEFLAALESNDIAAVKSLLADGSVDVNARVSVPDLDRDDDPLVVLAALYDRVEIVALLLDAGAQIDDVNDRGDSLCHLAVRSGRTSVLKLLIARNANLTLRNQDNHTPLEAAIQYKAQRAVMLLIDATITAGTPLDDATTWRAAMVSADVTRWLIFKHRINLSALRGVRGRTLLHEAMWRRAGVFNTLIKAAGIDVDVRDQDGCSVAHLACATRNDRALTRLIAAGANVDLANNHGNTPLHIASQDHRGRACVTLLLAAGANVNAKNKKGRTPCHVAPKFWSCLSSLVAFGANLDEPDNDGITMRQLFPFQFVEEDRLICPSARRRVLGVQLSFVRERAFDVCVGLQSLRFDALCMCEILLHSCGPVAPLIAFHRWWQIATKIKHFRDQIKSIEK